MGKTHYTAFLYYDSDSVRGYIREISVATFLQIQTDIYIYIYIYDLCLFANFVFSLSDLGDATLGKRRKCDILPMIFFELNVGHSRTGYPWNQNIHNHTCSSSTQKNLLKPLR